MKFLKKPKKKRNDKLIPYKQELFTSLHEDVPASDIPKGGVSKSDNILLMGSYARVRYGSREWSTTELPSIATGDTANQSGTTMTPNDSFNANINGQYIYWGDGTTNTIINADPDGAWATLNASATRTAESYTHRGQVHGIYWHKKSQKIFLHIDNRLFYTTYSVGTWTQIHLSSEQTGTLAYSKSTFDSFQNHVYLFNANGIYKIETSETVIEAIKINSTVPSNTIVTATKSTSFDSVVSEVESKGNKFGRNYLFSLSKLADTGSRDRTTARIRKETPTNSIREDDDWKDYKTAWFNSQINGTHSQEFGSGDNPGTQFRIYALSNSTKNLYEWFVLENQAIKITMSVNMRIATLTSSGTTATATTDIEHNFPINSSIVIAGAAQSDYNGTFTITVTGLKTFTYTMLADPAVNTATGKIKSTLTLTRSTPFTFTSCEKSWDGIASVISASMKTTFPEAPHSYCYYDDSAATLNFVGGNVNISVDTLTTPGSDYNTLGSGYIDTTADTTGYLNAWHVLGNNSQIDYSGDPSTNSGAFALNIPSGQYGWTHYSLYTSKMYGIDTEIAGNQVINGELFIWNKDIPVAKVLQGAISSSVITLTAGTVGQEDIGCRIYFGDGHWTTITFIETSSIFHITDAGTSSATTFVIGAEELNVCSQSGTTVTKESGNNFASSDVGKTIYWAGETYGVIKSYTNSTTVEVYDSTTRSSVACTLEPSGRDFNDITTDEILGFRERDYLLVNRFWTALPSGGLGVINSGFMVVASRVDIKAYYSQFITTYNYLAGHYYSEWQYVDFKDRLISIQEMPNQIIFFCTKSTWRTETNVSSSVDDARTGESIPILPGHDIIDETIGALDQGGITNYGTGQKIVITSEPGIRLFDGYRYGENLVTDEHGRGYILKTIQQMRSRFDCIYEPNLYGFIFWSNTSTDTLTADTNLRNLGETDICYRRAMTKEQGSGFSKLNGDDWLWPNVEGGVIEVEDSNENKILLVFDQKSAKSYILSTRLLPSIESQAISYVDKENDQDTEIASSLRLGEHTAEHEEDKIRIEEQYLFLRPELESNKDAASHDSYGFRDAQRLTVKAYINGSTTGTSLVNTVNPKAELNMPEKVEDRRIQMEFNGLASELIYIKHKINYTILNRRQSPANVVQQDAYERNLNYPIFWATRGRFFYYNLYTGNAVDSGTVTTKVTGPDGVSNSGITVIDTLTWTNAQTVASGGTFTFMFGFRNNTGDIANESIFDLGDNITIKITRTASSALKFTYTNGTDTLDLDLTYSVAWLNIAIIKANTALSIYVNGVLIDSETITVPVALSGNIVAYSNTNNCDIFDVRIFSSAITANELLWYYDNVVNKAGKSLLPNGEA